MFIEKALLLCSVSRRKHDDTQATKNDHETGICDILYSSKFGPDGEWITKPPSIVYSGDMGSSTFARYDTRLYTVFLCSSICGISKCVLP